MLKILKLCNWWQLFFGYMYRYVRLTQQGLEKLNDTTTKDFFRSTNQRGLDALVQIMQKRNRLEYFEDIGCIRKMRNYQCSNCGQQGHNIKTCMQECTRCQFKPCCSPSHVKKANGMWIRQCTQD